MISYHNNALYSIEELATSTVNYSLSENVEFIITLSRFRYRKGLKLVTIQS